MAAEQRKLATIMAVDVAGYSRAAERDESGAAEAVARWRARLAEIAAPLGGRIFNTAGDGAMIEFAAASPAIDAALQLLAAGRAEPLPPLRIGLHLGEVIVADGGDLLGHGVNVAARLQALAEPGTALVSKAMPIARADAPLRSLGRLRLDKMDERIEVFALGAPSWVRFWRVRWRRWRGAAAALGFASLLAAVGVGAIVLTDSTRSHTPRLAVLRFESQGEATPYLAEGLADELISELSRVEGMEVSARASSFALDGGRATPREAARELGATLVLTGALQASSSAIVVRAQLVEAPAGRQLWQDEFERPPDQVFALRRDLALRVANAAGVRFAAPPSRRVDLDAFRLYARGRERQIGGTLTDQSEARDLFRAAVERDPRFAEAWAWLARAEFSTAHLRYLSSLPAAAIQEDDDMAPALAAADRAIALDPTLSEPHVVKGSVYALVGKWREADRESRRAEENGGYVARYLMQVGRVSEALSRSRREAELNPLDYRTMSFLQLACAAANDRACGLRSARRAFELGPDDPEAFYNLYRWMIDAGDRDGARRLLQDNRHLLPALFGYFHPIDERYLTWLLEGGPAPPASAVVAAFDRGEAYLDVAISMLVNAGHVDAAIALLDRWDEAYRPLLFNLYELSPRWRIIRRSRQFWALMDREGLTKFWSETGRWPDFCDADPGVCPLRTP